MNRFKKKKQIFRKKAKKKKNSLVGRPRAAAKPIRARSLVPPQMERAVVGPPQWAHQPTNCRVRNGNNASLSGRDRISRWKFDRVPIHFFFGIFNTPLKTKQNKKHLRKWSFHDTGQNIMRSLIFDWFEMLVDQVWSMELISRNSSRVAKSVNVELPSFESMETR